MEEMERFFHTLLLWFLPSSLALLILLGSHFPLTECSLRPECNEVLFVDRTTSDDFHSVWPRVYRCNVVDSQSVECPMTFRVRDKFMRLVTKLCVRGMFHINCYHGKYNASVRVYSDLTNKDLLIKCYQRPSASQKYCAPQGEDLLVTYSGNAFCPAAVSDKVQELLVVHQNAVYKNLLKMTRSNPCHLNTNSRQSSKPEGAVISVIRPDNDGGLYTCTVRISASSRVEKVCLKFIHFETFGENIGLTIRSSDRTRRISKQTWQDDPSDICIPVVKWSVPILFELSQGYRTPQNHIVLFEYYSVFKPENTDDDDDDDDDDDLYWLFVIPGVIILVWCCYHCCKDDKDETEGGGETAHSLHAANDDESHIALQDTTTRLSNSHAGGGDGDAYRGSTRSLTGAAAEPSAPPLIETPPPPISSTLPPPSYESLFPESKH